MNGEASDVLAGSRSQVGAVPSNGLISMEPAGLSGAVDDGQSRRVVEDYVITGDATRMIPEGLRGATGTAPEHDMLVVVGDAGAGGEVGELLREGATEAVAVYANPSVGSELRSEGEVGRRPRASRKDGPGSERFGAEAQRGGPSQSAVPTARSRSARAVGDVEPRVLGRDAGRA